MYLQPLNMFRHINCHPQSLSIKELQVRAVSKHTIGGFTVEVFTQLTILKCIDAQNYEINIKSNNTLCLK